MNKILIDEAAVKLVLEALESLIFNKPFTHRYGDVITALREALAEQPAPKVVDCHVTGVCVQSGLWAEQPAQQEPVAKDNSNYRLDPPWRLDPLYTAPQPAQRKPLTNLEGLKLAYRHPWLNNLSANAVGRTALRDAFLQGVRDAEAAHGIKENT